MSQSQEADPVAHAKAIAPLLERSTAEIERERRLPQALLDELLDAGLFGLLLPRAYGGVEAEPVVFMQGSAGGSRNAERAAQPSVRRSRRKA
jgi:alkylation response protein AidB-like acyl-CoA dehydrogenase